MRKCGIFLVGFKFKTVAFIQMLWYCTTTGAPLEMNCLIKVTCLLQKARNYNEDLIIFDVEDQNHKNSLHLNDNLSVGGSSPEY